MRYLYLILCFISIKIFAQAEIKGIVQTSQEKPIARVNITLKNKQGQIKAFTFSKSDGSFNLTAQEFGDFDLQFNSGDYQLFTMPLSIVKKGESFQFNSIILNEKETREIEEVVIKRTKPISIKKDTIEFLAQRFANGTERNLEDLLKKLPGLKIDHDGKIRIGGKEVERVMVENDDLFEKGYQTLTQNMPSDPVEKVQVLSNHSKNKLLKDIEKSEAIAINITLKEEAKGQWLGNVLLASTSYKEDMRQGKINLMNFRKNRKVYFLYNGNNLGLNEMKGVQYLINPSTSIDAENVGSNVDLSSIINLHQRNYMFEDNRTNFNKDHLASFNYIYNFKNDWKIKFVTLYNTTQNRNYVDSYYKFDYQGNSFTNNENKSWKQSLKNVVGKLELLKEFKNQSNLVFYNKLSLLDQTNDNDFIFNGQLNNQWGSSDAFNNENRLVYTKKLDSSRAVVAVARYIHQTTDYLFYDENNVFAELLQNPNAQKVEQDVATKMNFLGIKLSYLKSYNEDEKLNVNMGNELRTDRLNSFLTVKDEAGNSIAVNDDYVNNTDFLLNNWFINGQFSKKYKRWNYDLAINARWLHSNLNDEVKNSLQLIPKVSISYQDRRTGSYSLSIERNISTNNIDQLYSNNIYKGNRSFYSSDVGFAILPSYNVLFSLKRGSVTSKSLRLDITYNKREYYLSQHIIINPNYNFSQSILVKDSDDWYTILELNQYFKSIKTRFTIFGNFNYNTYENSVNNSAFIKSRFMVYKIGLEGRTAWSSFFNIGGGFHWEFNHINSDVNNHSYVNQKGFVNSNFKVNSNFNIESYIDYYRFGNTSENDIYFWDTKLNYNFKRHKMNVFLLGNNLLNVDKIQRYSTNNISESLYTQRLLPRHIVLGINKSF